MQSPIFLLGTQRSGTTLLGRMLSAHPDVFIKNELHMRSVFTPGASRADIEQNIDRIIQRDVGKSIAQLLEDDGKKIWGLKDPELTSHLDAIKQFLPDARFIIITRDGRAVVNSYIENKWGLGTNAYTGALRWRREVESQLAFQAEHPYKVFRISYEDLITDQEATLRSVCKFLGLSFSDTMMNHEEQKSYVSKNRENIHTFRAPDPELARKWRKRLSPHQVRIIESVARDTLTKLGYEPEHEPYQPPGWMVAYYKVHQAILGEIQIQYRWRIKGIQRSLKKRFRPLVRSTP